MAYWSVPDEFNIAGVKAARKPWHVIVCSLVGLWAGLVIGYITEYMTSHSYKPVREVVDSCKTGAATNIIYGLALGYNSTIVPIISIIIASYVSHKLCGFYGIALAALGMLSNLPVGLAIDGYGPISDNAGGIAEMSSCGHEVRKITDALDAAGNTTAAIGKGFAIGSAALVSLALYGGFITNVRVWTHKQGHSLNARHGLLDAPITDPLIFGGLLLGAMLPYAFSAFTMKAVGKAAKGMVQEVRRQFKDGEILAGRRDPDYKACISVSTNESLREMIAPGALVIVTPLVFGMLFGPKGLAGMLPGSLVSGVQMAISAANTGGAWDNCKKFVEAGQFIDDDGRVQGKKSEIHKAAVIGDTVGDPLKDTSGPSLNILVKLMAILSLVFAEFFCITGWLVVPFHDYD